MIERGLAPIDFSMPIAFLFSITGGLLALVIMGFLVRWEGKVFSLIGISLAGAAAHNLGQISVAVLLLGDGHRFPDPFRGICRGA